MKPVLHACSITHEPVRVDAPVLDMLTVIPARGGSKGLPRKNIIELAGKPLITYSIEAARKVRANNRIVVSTEDHEIADVARAYGAEVPFLRPSELATSEANLGKALQYTVDRIRDEGFRPDAILYLMPTSPFRNTRLMNTMVGKLSAGYQGVTTVKLITHNRRNFYVVGDEERTGCWTSILTNRASNCFRPYGVLSGFRTSIAPRGNFTLTIDDPVMFIDIDTHNDLLLAEMVIDNKLFDFDAC